VSRNDHTWVCIQVLVDQALEGRVSSPPSSPAPVLGNRQQQVWGSSR